MKTVIVKLGGAAITDKHCISQISSTLNSLLTQVNEAYRFLQSQDGPHQLILIHGAGGYGHPPAKQYLVKQGWYNSNQNSMSTAAGAIIMNKHHHQQHTLTEEDQKFGFSATRQQVLDLHQQLLQRLQAFGLPVVTVSAFDHVQTNAGEPTAESSRRLAVRVQHLLSLGFIPLLFGDAVLDLAWGCTILSGDVIMYQLAMYLQHGVDRCVFVTDVPGIFTGDPKNVNTGGGSDVTLIKHIPVDSTPGDHDDGKLIMMVDEKAEDGGGVVDVTGGMNGKIKWTKKIVLDSSVSEVVVCQAGSSEMYHAITLAPISIFPGTDGDGSCSLDHLSLTLFTKNKKPALVDRTSSILSSPLLHYIILTFTLYRITR